MADRRRDDKGRLLWPGEFQRPDGKYEFKYIDKKGDRHSVYSWRLVSTDLPKLGKHEHAPLRELEQKIENDMRDDILYHEAKRLTINAFWDNYIQLKKELKESTRNNYIYMYDHYVRPDFGERILATIKYTDVKKFYLSLVYDRGFQLNSVEIINTLLHPLFTAAVRDDYIRKNPSDGVMMEIKKSHQFETNKRRALTIEQQEAFIHFTANSHQYRHWLPLFTVLLGTGGRIGEILGLRWSDCDFNENIIDINHNLVYRKHVDGQARFYITTPKTKAGTRIIPMLSEVRKALMEEYKRQLDEGFCESEIDGYSGFIFKTRYNTVMSPHCVNRAIERISKAYNEQETAAAKKEFREPVLLPHFTCHHLRHTFCTRFCENETNLKVIQEIMGHADITTTMNIYNEATKDKKVEAFSGLEGKIKIS